MKASKTPPPSRPRGDHRELLAEVAAANPDLEPSAMFGSQGLKLGGRNFALLVKGSLVVKLPAGRVDDLCAAATGSRFEPSPGRQMRQWLALPPDSGEADALLAEALAYARSAG